MNKVLTFVLWDTNTSNLWSLLSLLSNNSNINLKSDFPNMLTGIMILSETLIVSVATFLMVVTYVSSGKLPCVLIVVLESAEDMIFLTLEFWENNEVWVKFKSGLTPAKVFANGTIALVPPTYKLAGSIFCVYLRLFSCFLFVSNSFSFTFSSSRIIFSLLTS